MAALRATIAAFAAILTLSVGAVAQDRSTGAREGQGGTESWKAPHDPNASPQSAIRHGQIDENSVQSLLQSKGYLDVRNLKRAGKNYTAQANKDGRDVRVKVDGQSGRIEEIGG
jgi:hypothetical protein